MSGLPLLSGSPPAQSEDSTENEVACRKCNKEFNFLFTRSRKCHHCGYMYCHNCTDYQALMPRAGGQGDSGYDLVNVCAFCIEYLQITAAGRGQLKSMPLSKLKKYAGAYNIQISRAVEKDDIINALLSARRPNGCLPGVNEAYYRRYSVPNRSGSRPRGLFSSRPEPAPNPPPRPPTGSVNASQREFARPDLTPDLTPDPEPRPAPNYQTRPPNSPPSNYDAHSHSHPPYTPNPLPSPPRNTRNNSYNPHYTQYPQQQQQQPPPPPPQHSYPQYVPRARPPPPPSSSRPAPAPAPAARSVPPPPPPPPPSLDELLNMSPQSISTLPISSLKQILFQNHVNTSATTILEKSDLVKRVVELVEVEKREREEKEEREREEREEEEMAIREAREAREFERRQREREEAAARATPNRSTNPEHRARVDDASDDDDSIHHPPPSSSSTPPQEEINILPPQSPSPRPPSEDYPMAPTPPPATATPSSSPPPSSSLPKPQTKPHERHTGLCVICQDEDANIAIVDCGHMAMCRACSELVMASSRECPLCRTRIVTEQRLLRIFKT